MTFLAFLAGVVFGAACIIFAVSLPLKITEIEMPSRLKPVVLEADEDPDDAA